MNRRSFIATLGVALTAPLLPIKKLLTRAPVPGTWGAVVRSETPEFARFYGGMAGGGKSMRMLEGIQEAFNDTGPWMGFSREGFGARQPSLEAIRARIEKAID